MLICIPVPLNKLLTFSMKANQMISHYARLADCARKPNYDFRQLYYVTGFFVVFFNKVGLQPFNKLSRKRKKSQWLSSFACSTFKNTVFENQPSVMS